MELNIKTAVNGYILTYWEEIEKDVKEERHIAVEDVAEGADCISEARLTQKLLFEVCEYFSIFTSKHSEEQLRIIIVNKNGKEID